MLLAALAGSLLLVGPRSVVWSRWVIGSALLALAIGAPNIWYQATHHWPELTMGDALRANNGSAVRLLMWPFLLILLGPPLTPVWVAGLVALWRRPQWRAVQCVAVAFPLLLVIVFIAGTQFYYPLGLLTVLLAAGCVPVADFVARFAAWRRWLIVGIVLNAGISALIALPLVPVSVLGDTPIPVINQTARDSVGWPTYVTQVSEVYDALSARAARHAVVIASNYGEAGALARYGPDAGLPAVFSGQNQLHYQSRPPEATRVVIVVGGQVATARREFRSCRVERRLTNATDVDNEEEGQPVAVCRGPLHPWPTMWAAFQNYD